MSGERSPLFNGGRGHDNEMGSNYGTPISPADCSISPTIDTSSRSLRHRRNSIRAMAAAADISARRESQLQRMNSMGSTGIPQLPLVNSIPKPLIEIPSMESLDVGVEVQRRIQQSSKSNGHTPSKSTNNSILKTMHQIISQIPAVAIASILNFMVGIPFGASYFPTELPLPSKEVLGLRMFLFATMVAQLVFTFKSNFDNGIGLQMVENVPFCLELARIVMDVQGHGSGAVSTLFFLFALSSVIVGLVFYLLGRFEMGRVVYFFPSHVLVGCIGGIGLFIVVTSLEVTTNTSFSFTAEGFNDCIVQNMHLLWPVIAFEVVLRLLMRVTEKNGEPEYPLLGPIYYCFITPMFYAFLWCLGISIGTAEDAGYFFPPLSSTGSVFNASLFDIFTEIHPTLISWKAVMKSIPTMISLTAFSLIHVPINIPAFAISSNVEPDMNAELIAHGFSNALSGLFGGLQNYMAYSNSVIYSKSNGKGKASSLAIVATTILIFLYGPTMAQYVPRCMAGTVLLHVGIDLFLEGSIESYGDYDKLEYTGIWLITIVMVLFGMDAALVAGVIAALSTYVAQSIVYQHPIKGSLSGARLRSSAWNRSAEATQILLKGRQRIYVIALQGHIFFGNAVGMSDDIKNSLNEKRKAGDEPAVVILDFTSVLGLDSSAAQSIAKLKAFLLKNFNVEIIIFVTGHEDGFRCSYDLSHKVVDNIDRRSIHIVEQDRPSVISSTHEHRLSLAAGALASYVESETETKSSLIAEIPNSTVCETLDEALVFAEDVLVAIENPSILKSDSNELFPFIRSSSENLNEVKSVLETLFQNASHNEIDTLYNLLTPEKYRCGDTVWNQGDASESLKVVVDGYLQSLLEDECGATESICPGTTIGELGLVQGIPHLTTVKVMSEEATLYSLSLEDWNTLTEQQPKVARHIDMLLIRYLAHRVQHVSNNILDRRSLPV